MANRSPCLSLHFFEIKTKLVTSILRTVVCNFFISLFSPQSQFRLRRYIQPVWQASEGEGNRKDERVKGEKIGRERIAVGDAFPQPVGKTAKRSVFRKTVQSPSFALLCTNLIPFSSKDRRVSSRISSKRSLDLSALLNVNMRRPLRF